MLVTVLALSVALANETGVAVTSLEVLLSILLLAMATILPGLQYIYKLEVAIPAVIGGTLLVWISWIALLGAPHVSRVTRIVFVICVLLLMETIASWLDKYSRQFSLTGGLILLVAGAVAGGLVLPYFRAGFENVVDVEERRIFPGPLPPNLQAQANQGALKTWGLGIAGLASILWLTVSVAPSLNFTRGVGESNIDFIILSSAILCVVLTLISRTFLARFAFWQNVTCHLAGLVWLGGAVYSVIENFHFHPLLMPPLILAALWTWISLIFSAVVLHNHSLSTRALLLPSICTAAVFASFYWALTTGLYFARMAVTYSWSLLTIALACLVNFALVLSSGAILTEVSVKGPGQLAGAIYGPMRLLAQDQSLLTVQVVVLIWFPALVVAHIPSSTNERWSAIACTLGGFILFLSPLFFWILRLHTRHTLFEKHLRLGTPELQPPYPLLVKPVGRSLIAVLRKCGPESSSPITVDSEWCLVHAGDVNLRNLIAMALASFSVIGILYYVSDYGINSVHSSMDS
jgi:hypothetical protein